MGMNSGIHDAFNLADKLVAILRGEAGEDVLDRYERQRRHVAVQHTQAQTMRNKRLLAEKDPAVRQEEPRRTAPHRRGPEARARVPAALVADRKPARSGEDSVNRVMSEPEHGSPKFGGWHGKCMRFRCTAVPALAPCWKDDRACTVGG